MQELQRIGQRLDALEVAPREPAGASKLADLVEAHSAAITVLEGTLAPLPMWRKEILLAVADGIERTDRAERRVESTIRSARKKLEALGLEHDGLEAEAAELHERDGGGGDDGEVPTVPTLVADVGDEPSSIPGVTRSQLARARGF